MATRLQHLAMNCRDMAAQEEFYSRHFGFERCRVFKHGEEGEFIMLRLGEFRMELFGADAPAGATGGPQPVGFVHLCFAVDDIEASEAELKEAGVATEGVIDCSDDFPGLKVCFFNDPEGNRVELMEGWQDEANPPPRAD